MADRKTIALYRRRRRSGGGTTTLSITDPGAYIWLTSESTKDIGTTFTVADSADGGAGTYSLDIVITEGGTLTCNPAGTGTVTGDGTGTLNIAGTIAQINGELNGADWGGLVNEDAAATITFTRDSDSAFITDTIYLLALPALETTNLIETLATGTSLFPNMTTALSGSSATVAVEAEDSYVRPVITGFTLTDNANGTFDVDFTTDTANGDYRIIGTTNTTLLSGETTAAVSGDYIFGGNDLTGGAGSVIYDSGLVAGGTAGAKNATSGSLANGTYYVHVVHVSDTLDESGTGDRIASYVYSDTVTTTGGGSSLLLSGGVDYLVLNDGTSKITLA